MTKKQAKDDSKYYALIPTIIVEPLLAQSDSEAELKLVQEFRRIVSEKLDAELIEYLGMVTIPVDDFSNAKVTIETLEPDQFVPNIPTHSIFDVLGIPKHLIDTTRGNNYSATGHALTILSDLQK